MGQQVHIFVKLTFKHVHLSTLQFFLKTIRAGEFFLPPPLFFLLQKALCKATLHLVLSQKAPCKPTVSSCFVTRGFTKLFARSHHERLCVDFSSHLIWSLKAQEKRHLSSRFITKGTLLKHSITNHSVPNGPFILSQKALFILNMLYTVLSQEASCRPNLSEKALCNLTFYIAYDIKDPVQTKPALTKSCVQTKSADEIFQKRLCEE